jgi:hypothetical protein
MHFFRQHITIFLIWKLTYSYYIIFETWNVECDWKNLTIKKHNNMKH